MEEEDSEKNLVQTDTSRRGKSRTKENRENFSILKTVIHELEDIDMKLTQYWKRNNVRNGTQTRQTLSCNPCLYTQYILINPIEI